MTEEEFERLVMEAFKPVHEALGRLAKTCFDASEGLFIVWLEKAETARRGGE